jgi:hypothetical protein
MYAHTPSAPNNQSSPKKEKREKKLSMHVKSLTVKLVKFLHASRSARKQPPEDTRLVLRVWRRLRRVAGHEAVSGGGQTGTHRPRIHFVFDVYVFSLLVTCRGLFKTHLSCNNAAQGRSTFDFRYMHIDMLRHTHMLTVMQPVHVLSMTTRVICEHSEAPPSHTVNI